MSDSHDSLCLYAEFACEVCQTNQCVCGLIALVCDQERERIAQAIYVVRNRWLDNFTKEVTGAGPDAVLSAFDKSIRLARSGGNDE